MGDSNWNVVRELNGRLAWFRPDSDAQPQWLDEPEPRERLQGLIGEDRIQLCFAAPAERLRLQVLEIAAEEKKHLEQALPFMLEEQLAQDIEGLHFALQDLGELRYGVAICDRDDMAAWASLLEDYPVNTWLPEPLTLPWEEGQWTLVLEGDRALLRTGACEGAGMERELAPAMLQAAIADIELPTSLVVYSEHPDADAAVIPEALVDRAQWRKGNYSAALMLSNLNAPVLNLRQGDFAPRLPLARWWRDWRLVAGVFAAAIAVQLLATWAEYAQLGRENLALRGAIEASYRQVNPRGAIVDPERQLRTQLGGLKGGGEASHFVALASRVGAVISKHPGTTLASINYSQRNSEMRLSIVAVDYGMVEKIRGAIAADGLEAVLENSNAQGNEVRARLRITERT